MPFKDWIEKYPHVKALLQSDDDSLMYHPDDGRGGGARFHHRTASAETTTFQAQVTQVRRWAAIIRASEQEGLWLACGHRLVGSPDAGCQVCGDDPDDAAHERVQAILAAVHALSVATADGQRSLDASDD